MKKIIKSLGMSIKEFSEYYDIPYNTVRQWWNGDRKPPKWVIKLLNKLIESKKNGEQIEMFGEYVYEVYDLRDKRSLGLRNNEFAAAVFLQSAKTAYIGGGMI